MSPGMRWALAWRWAVVIVGSTLGGAAAGLLVGSLLEGRWLL